MDADGLTEEERKHKPWRVDVFIGCGLALLVAAVSGGAAYKLAGDIQANRESFIREECEDVNARHDNSVAQVRSLNEQAIIEAGGDKELIAQIKNSETYTLTIIDALVPPRNCDERVEEATLQGD